MNEKAYSVESLIASESFQAYCLQTSPAAVAEWEQWLQQHPEKQAEVKEAQNWVLAMHSIPKSDEAQEEWHKLSSQLPHTAIAPAAKVVPVRRRWTQLGIAAVIALLLGWGIWYINNPVPTYTEFSTAFGEVQTLQLPDGSQLMLNGNSKATFSTDWSAEKQREIWLEGEGYFDVEHDEHHPFVVHMKYGDIQVLGTQFNALHREAVQQVTLIEGSVSLTPQQQKAIKLQPGDQVVITEGKWEKRKIDVETVTAWKDNLMIFRDAAIREIIEKLKWDFNWDIQVMETSILDRRVNATIQENNPELLLQALAEIYDLEFEKKGEGQYLIK